jgi:hypothetical protein
MQTPGVNQTLSSVRRRSIILLLKNGIDFTNAQALRYKQTLKIKIGVLITPLLIKFERYDPTVTVCDQKKNKKKI